MIINSLVDSILTVIELQYLLVSKWVPDHMLMQLGWPWCEKVWNHKRERGRQTDRQEASSHQESGGRSTLSRLTLKMWEMHVGAARWRRVVRTSVAIRVNKARRGSQDMSVCLSVYPSVCASLGLQAGDLYGPSHSLCYVNLPKLSKAAWTTMEG